MCTNIIVTRHNDVCAHKTIDAPTLVVYAYVSEDSFKALIGEEKQTRTGAVMRRVMGSEDTLEIEVRAGGDWVELEESVTHLKLYQYNGAMR